MGFSITREILVLGKQIPIVDFVVIPSIEPTPQTLNPNAPNTNCQPLAGYLPTTCQPLADS